MSAATGPQGRQEHLGRIVHIASGKGGVGKSLVAANLGVALARRGRTVILVDLDLGASNLHTILGVRNRNAGLGSLIFKKVRNLTALLAETGEPRLWLIPGDNLLPGAANIEWQVKRKIVKELAELPADFIILDLGAGSAWNVVDFWLTVPGGLVVIVPELTSVLNAYSFLKSAAFRLLSQAFPEGGAERQEVLDFAARKTEGSGSSFLDFARDLARRHPARGEAALRSLIGLVPSVLLNRAREAADVDLGHSLREIAERNLGISIAFGAFLPDDPAVSGSLNARKPLLALDPGSPFSRSLGAFASRLAESPLPSPIAPPRALASVDLDELAREALGPGSGPVSGPGSASGD
jgi:flagellar biosynthesis protein FlhG